MSEVRSVPFGRPWITDEDRKAILDVLDTPILTHGPRGAAFEQEFATFLGGGTCVSVSSCMAALHLAWLALGAGPGDEVIVPAQTHVATVHAVEWVGATPVFVDCDPRTGNLTPESVEAAVTTRTKGVAVVHFVGIPCDMEGIVRVAERHGLRVVEDCALAVGASRAGRHVGLFGDAGTFSFYPVKHLATGEGGMLVSRSAQLADRVRLTRGFGVDRSHAERGASGGYDVPALGLNYRMSELHAALGISQLARVGENLALRDRHFRALASALRAPDVTILDSDALDAVSARYCLTIVLGEGLAGRRDEVAELVRAQGVGTSVYYPQPVPRMSYYRAKYSYDAGRFPHATRISDESLSLPVGPHLADDDVAYVADVVSRVLEKVRRT